MPYTIKQAYKQWIGHRILIVVPILFYLLGYHFFYQFAELGDPGFRVHQEEIADYKNIKNQEVAQRYVVTSTFLLELFVGLGVIAHIGHRFLLSSRHYGCARILLFPLLLIAGLLFHTLYIEEGIMLFRFLGMEFLQNTLGQVVGFPRVQVFCQAGGEVNLLSTKFTPNALDTVRCMVDWTNVLAILVGIGTCAILSLSVDKISAYDVDISQTSGFDRKLVTLVASELSQSIRSLLLLALFFVAGLAFLAAWLKWPEVFLSSDEIGGYRSLVRGLLLVNGTLYSVIIAAIFLPSYLKLSAYGRRLAEQSIDKSYKGALDKWMVEYGLRLSPGENTRIFLSITGPLITAFLTQLFNA